MRRTSLFLFILGIAFASAHSTAQHQLVPVSQLKGAPALELALRKLDTVGNLMMTTAHPDDENNAMLAYFSHGQGFRTSLVTATHGEGGQNEIGPELFEALAVLRTEELAAAHRFDGAEQFFTRAIDFGFSFSVEETLEKWGHQEILGDYVRMIRTIRPDVIVGFVFDGDGGGQHHQTSSRLTLEAFRAAADLTKFPEQIKDGLRAWQPKKFYYTAGFGGPPGGAGRAGGAGQAAPAAPSTLIEAPTALQFAGGDSFDPVLGRTYNELAGEARSMHKCQGMSQLLPLPASTGGGGFGGGGGPGGVRAYRLRDTVLAGGVGRTDRDVFDGVDTSLRSLLAFSPTSAEATVGTPDVRTELGTGLDRISAAVAEARQAMASGGEAAAVAPLTRGLKALRDVRAWLAGSPLADSAKYEIDFRLSQKEPQFAKALMLAADVRIDAVAREGLVVAGQPLAVDLMAANRGKSAVDVAVVANGFGAAVACEAGALAPGASRNCNKTVTVPADARLTAAHFHTGTQGARYVFDADVPFGLPFRPTPYTATFTMTVDNTPFTLTLPIQARSDLDIFAGEKRQEVHVVPAFSVATTPDTVIVPLNPSTRDSQASGSAAARSGQGPAAAKEIRVTVTNHSKGAALADVALEVPPGWRATPPTQPVTFTREDESMTVRFALQPPAAAALAAAAMKPGGNQFKVNAVVRSGDVASGFSRTFTQGYQVVEYPHTTRRHVLTAPQAAVKALDVNVKPNLSLGYVMGVGDEVPAALIQLGVKLTLIDPEELAWGDLSRYDVIMTGVRAYERRVDLRANNQRLLDYAKAGGTVIVQYNKFEFNDAQYGPFAAKVGRERVTDENAEMKLLQPQHPVFNTPNAIGRADWAGWVQERGLYFLDEAGRDPQYQDLIEFAEPFPYNKGVKRGALVEAKVGQGRWIYVGLGLWRQLPAGTDGAFRLMANLISLP